MTHQETFDLVVAHLRAQGRKAMDGDVCRYRAADGCKCAAGCLIPDERYRRSMEGKRATAEEVRGVLEDLGHSVCLVRDLQCIHDFCCVSDWEREFRLLTKQYDLTYTPPQGATP